MPNQRLDRLNLLAPFMQMPVHDFIRRAHERHGIILCVVFTWRSMQQQFELYKKGRALDATGAWVITDQGAVVTRARPGTSAHNVIHKTGQPAALAADLVPMDAATGALQWIAGLEFWGKLYDIAWDCGLDPLGDQIGAHLKGDWCHFEEPGWQLKLDALGLVQPVTDMPRIT